jgi:hypothetical protein
MRGVGATLLRCARAASSQGLYVCVFVCVCVCVCVLVGGHKAARDCSLGGGGGGCVPRCVAGFAVLSLDKRRVTACSKREFTRA